MYSMLACLLQFSAYPAATFYFVMKYCLMFTVTSCVGKLVLFKGYATFVMCLMAFACIITGLL